MKFLIMDDNNCCSKYLRDLITINGDEYLALEEDIDVYSAYMLYKPDWVLIDIQMKDMNGFTIVEQLVRKLPEVLVAVISDFNDERLRLRAERSGASAFISKENLTGIYNIFNGVKRK